MDNQAKAEEIYSRLIDGTMYREKAIQIIAEGLESYASPAYLSDETVADRLNSAEKYLSEVSPSLRDELQKHRLRRMVIEIMADYRLSGKKPVQPTDETSDGWISVDEIPAMKDGWEHSDQCVLKYDSEGEGGKVSGYGIGYYHSNSPYRGSGWIDFNNLGRKPVGWKYVEGVPTKPLPEHLKDPSFLFDKNHVSQQRYLNPPTKPLTHQNNKEK